jgi:hypothetical protein
MKNQMVRAIIGLSLTLSIFSPVILAQNAQNPDNPSLGDLARQELERKKNQAPSKVVLTNDGGTTPSPSAGQQPRSVAPQTPADADSTSQVSPVDCLRILNTAGITYSSTFNLGFPTRLSALGPPKVQGTPPSQDSAGLIGENLASGAKGGYVFTYSAGTKDANGRVNTYTVRADPLPPVTAGQKHYFTDQSGVIRQENDKLANANSPPFTVEEYEAAWRAGEENKYAKVEQAAALLASAAPSPEEKEAAGVVGELGSGLASLKKSKCPLTTKDFVTLNALVDLVCQVKLDACGRCADAPQELDPLTRDPNYSYQVSLTATGAEVIAVPKKPGAASFFSDGEKIYFSRAGRASPQSTLLGDIPIVTEATQRVVKQQAADAMAGVGLSPGEKNKAATVAGLALQLARIKAIQCPITTQGFVSSTEFENLACQSKSDACGTWCHKDPSRPDPLGRDPAYSYQFLVTTSGGEVIAAPKISGLPNFYCDGKNVYFSRAGRASPQSTLLGNAGSVAEAMRPGSQSNPTAEMEEKTKAVTARMASEKLSTEEKNGGFGVAALAMGGLALKLANCPITTQGFIGVPAIHNLVCPETSPPCGRCDDEETKLLEGVAQDPNYSYQMRFTALDGEVIAIPQKPGLASFYSDGEKIYFSRAGQASKQSTMLSDAGSFFWGVMTSQR